MYQEGREATMTYDEDWRGRVDPREVTKDTQVAEVVDGKVPQHPHCCQGVECIQEHHPCETE